MGHWNTVGTLAAINQTCGDSWISPTKLEILEMGLPLGLPQYKHGRSTDFNGFESDQKHDKNW